MIKSYTKYVAGLLRQLCLGRETCHQEPDTRPKRLPDALCHPVLFANGSDDDSEALKAFYENRPYVFQGKIFEPTQDDRELVGLQLRLSANALVFIKDARVVDYVGDPLGERFLTVSVSHGLKRCVHRCTICMGAKVLA